MANRVGRGDNPGVISWGWQLLRRPLTADAVLFEEGDLYCHLASKYLSLDDKDQATPMEASGIKNFSCGLAHCGQTFDNLLKYESHYNSCHRHVCVTCHRIYPSSHLLEIHVLETHDSMFSLLAEKQKMYQCLLENCECKFAACKERKNHMIKTHKYPSNYRFDSSRPARSSKASSSKSSISSNGSSVAMETEQHSQNEVFQTSNEAPQISSGRKFSYKVPDNFCFGQGAAKAFQGKGNRGGKSRKKKHWHNSDNKDKDTRVNIENVDMKDLTEGLPVP